MPPDSAKVSVIIVTHNSRSAIGDCLAAIPEASGRLTCEIIIIDNGSTDGTIEFIQAQAPHVLILEQNQNLGFGRACNLAAQKATAEFLLFVNPDASLDAGAVARLTEVFSSDDRTGFAVPRLRFPDDRFQPSCRRFPTIGNLVFARGSFVMQLLGRNKGGDGQYTLPDYPVTTEVQAVAGTVAMIRRDVFAQIGGFDPRFFLYMEDTDLCLRLNHNGYRNLFVPGAGAVHRWGRGSAAGKLVRIWRHHMSFWKYFLKQYPNGFSVVVLPFLLLVNGLVSSILPDRRAEI